MPFQVSPGVNVSEIDLTTVVPAVSTTEGAIAGVFKWGPVEERVLIDSEAKLATRFGKPTSDNYETFFTAANFLAYGNKLYVVRTVNSSANNAGSSGIAQQVKNRIAFDNATFSNNELYFIAKYPGDLGNSLKVSVCDSSAAYSSALNANVTIAIGNTVATCSNTTGVAVGDQVKLGNSSIGTQYLKVASVNTTAISFASKYTLGTAYTGSASRFWEFYNQVDAAPGTTKYVTDRSGTSDEIHIVVTDEDGAISGVPNTILEVYQGLSRATDAKTESGAGNHYTTVINDTSQWVYAVNHREGAGYVNTSINMTAVANTAPLADSLSGGTDTAPESTAALADLALGYDMFASAENVDISLVLQGKAIGGTNGEALGNYIIDNICEVRKDCVAFISPAYGDVVNNAGSEADDVVTFRNSLTASSYGVLDSGYKYQYDKYNDVYRYIPLNGDIAGLAVRTDDVRDPWFSPAGFNRGVIKNIVKLAFNPGKAERDILYKSDINPVTTFPGQGTLLFGDKTLLGRPSAFDRINVRRLFIVLEKAIATAAKASLFEFNDEFTRAQFRNLVEPFLRDVQGRRGIYDFQVVADETNNTGEVIDRNEFVADIYIKPAKSINFIQLNFVAVRTGVEFSEIVGS